MAGFDAAWKADKVLVCSLHQGRVRVHAWLSGVRGAAVIQEATRTAVYARRETGEPVWIEHYGAPAALPDHKRGFENYRTGGVD